MSDDLKATLAALLLLSFIIAIAYSGYRYSTAPCESPPEFTQGETVYIKLTGEQGMITYSYSCGTSYDVRLPDMRSVRMMHYEISEPYYE